jgi:adenosylcobinamide-GDP ribazoletransferase
VRPPRTGVGAAFGFLTVLPVWGDGGGELARAPLWFPLVGAFVGGVAGATRLGLDSTLGPLLASAMALLVAVVLTRGLHEDGLADTADGLGAHGTRERKLAAMQDSAVGAHGMLALLLCLLISFAALASLDPVDAARALVVAHVLARWSALPLALVLRPTKPTGLATLMRPTRSTVLGGTLLALGLVAAGAGPEAGALVWGAASAVTLGAGVLAQRAFGGATGDTYGATNKLVEGAVLVFLAGAWT